jgi:hypothetical protein
MSVEGLLELDEMAAKLEAGYRTQISTGAEARRTTSRYREVSCPANRPALGAEAKGK